MNPNDPMENPDAFKNVRVGENMVDADEVMGSDGYSHKGNSLENGRFGALGNHTQGHMRVRSRGSDGGLTAEFVSEQRHFEHSVSHKSDHKRNISKGGSSLKSFSSSSHNTNKSRNSSFNEKPVISSNHLQI